MNVVMNGPPLSASLTARLRRRALLLICLGLFAVVGVAVLYEAYKYFKLKQDIATTDKWVEEI